MAGPGGGWPTPTLTPVGRNDHTSALVATGLLVAILALAVGISLVDRSPGDPGVPAAVGGPAAPAPGTASAAAAAATPIVTPALTPTPDPSVGTPPPVTPEPSGGTRPPRVAVQVGPVRTCPPGSTPDVPGPRRQARPPTGTVRMAFDRAAAKIVLVGRRGDTGPVETWTFDVCTNVWTRMHPRTEPDYGPFGMLAYDAAADRTIAFPGVSTYDATRMDWTYHAWAYDLATDTWTESTGTEENVEGIRLAYDPVGRGVVALRLRSPRLMLRYDARADAWQPIAQDRYPFGDQYSLHILLAYDASVDRLVGYQLGEVRLFDIRTGTWSSPGTPSPPFFYGGYFSFGGEIAYDEAAQRTILFSSGNVLAYDAAADRWGTLYGTLSGDLGRCAGHPQCRMGHSMVFDPVNDRLVIYGGDVYTVAQAGMGTSDDVLAFDTRSRKWTTLLKASSAQAAQP